jgi:hypothetical protein
MADIRETCESKRTGICHTCVIVLAKFGTTESVVPWLCTCREEIKNLESKSVALQDRLTWSKMSPEIQRITWRNRNPPSGS